MLIVMEGAVEGGGQGDCAFALGAQQRPRPSETKNATQIFIGTAPSSYNRLPTWIQAYYFYLSQPNCKLQRDDPAKEDKQLLEAF
jgi:hypothetical protein